VRDQGRQVDRIERVIRLDGPLDGEQKARLMEIADKCPVHRTLTEIRIETRMADA
jgi:putative redox protein